MTDYTTSITIDQVIDALAAAITPFVGASQIVRAQVNRVAMPPNPSVVLTELLTVDLQAPWDDFVGTALGVTTLHGPARIDVQMDFYSTQAGDYCKTCKTVLRSAFGFGLFPATIKPLYTSDGVQSPLVTGEQQYESRWTLTASMQYNPVVTVPQDFAVSAAISTFTEV